MANYTLTTSTDTFTGTSGADVFSGPGGGADTLSGGFGDDAFHIDGNQAGTIDGGDGIDTVILDGDELGALTFAGIERLEISTTSLHATAEQIRNLGIERSAGVGDFHLFLQGAGGSVFLGSKFTGPISLHVDASQMTSGAFVIGTRPDDDILGSDFADVLHGDSGNDVLNGGEGDDVLSGGRGADIMIGSTGNDRYQVDNAADVVDELSFGGTGVDTVLTTISFSLAATVHVKGAVENLYLTGRSAIDGTGNALANAIIGNAGANDLYGEAGNDKLDGRDGDDHLTGGLGADKLFGRAGADIFHYVTTAESTLAAAGRDVIHDFSRVQGDKIDVSAIDADSGASGDQAFIFIGRASFTHRAGELRYKVLGDKAYVYGDTDGDGAVDVSIQLNGVASLLAGDFVL